jgi:ribosomal protein S18 acetylase RimI-like enzyme
MRRFLHEARRRGRRQVTLEVAEANESAIQFFSTQGFKPACRLAAYYGGRYDGLRMTHNL